MNDQAMQSRAAVAIGASAGGVDALLALMPMLPAGFAAAVLVVLHVPAGRSTLSELLSRVCALPVKEAEDKEALRDGHVYVAPGGYHLLVEPDRTLSLSVDEPVHFARPAIDLTFESAALAYEEQLLGIVLTGANSDGAAGLAAIREQGGQCWVQDPQEASSRAMPEAAINTGSAQWIAPLAQIGQKLAGWSPARAERQP
jgi:two-component system, chemotaxis family, protein-glutamate methylesterase/glutaminase